jgi:hypothetical protein
MFMMMVAYVGLPERLPDRDGGHGPEGGGTLVQRLSAEFFLIPPDAVERCVADVSACVSHLGVDATPALVERIVREHLVGMVKSEPPSGRQP